MILASARTLTRIRALGIRGATVLSYSPDEPRDDHGRWASGNGDLKLTPSISRAFNGKPVAIKGSMSHAQVGKLGEKIVLAYLKSHGHSDARAVNAAHGNFAVDLVQDHAAVEVKTGLASNGKSAQQWRATIGQPGPKETTSQRLISLFQTKVACSDSIVRFAQEKQLHLRKCWNTQSVTQWI